MAETAANERILDALLEALQGRDQDLRCSAVEVLGEMGAAAATEPVLDALLEALRDAGLAPQPPPSPPPPAHPLQACLPLT